MYLLKMHRIPAAVMTALQNDVRLQGVYSDLRDRPGRGDAKLVCRPEQRGAIEDHLIAKGMRPTGQNEKLYLAQMRSFHLIVSGEFLVTVKQIIGALPRDEAVRPKEIAHARIPPVIDLTQTPSDSDAEWPHAVRGSTRSRPYPSAARPAAIQQHAAASLSSASSGILSASSRLQAEQSPATIPAPSVQVARRRALEAAAAQYRVEAEQQALERRREHWRDSAASSSSAPNMQPLAPAPVESAAAAASSADAADDIAPTEPDSSEESFQEDTTLTQQQLGDGGSELQDINDRVSMPVIIHESFFVVPIPTVSEGQRTASTGQRLGLNPRVLRQRIDDSQSLPSSIIENDSMPLSSGESDTQELAVASQD
eukprot:TRINITY_DN12832_c0_g1_i1.p1 TRINITY_DN12832_c0_g1~~TRINITY_DN12832_c0_g1_i1.p1  ORF type:complete len:369 (+),score=56.81 TRINITY_DN12832_c0_g1_i1:435-1541(+)